MTTEYNVDIEQRVMQTKEICIAGDRIYIDCLCLEIKNFQSGAYSYTYEDIANLWIAPGIGLFKRVVSRTDDFNGTYVLLDYRQ